MSLIDFRVEKTAEILVNHSTCFKKGERALIVADWQARPLVLELYKKLIQKGASEVLVHFDVDEQVISRSYNEFGEIYLKNASAGQIKDYPKIADYIVANVDCWYRIYAQSNTRGFSNLDPKIISLRSKTVHPLIEKRVLKTRWVIANFPTEAGAQEAGMSLSEYETHVFSAVNDVDWKRTFKSQEKLRKLVDKTKKVKVVDKDTDLSFSIAGRVAVNCAGEFNMPDGEVFTSVVEDSTEGFITYSFPAIYMGKEFHNVQLEFKKGKVVKATADKGENDLNKILDVDSGGRTIGEFGIGNNYSIKIFTKDILFDEKIGGSIHLALGSGYKETKSKNESALHWDMIKDLRKNGELYFDGKLVQKNGKRLV
ncbi:MAG: Peptidase M29, aminopeptidase II [Candidatus Woesebacteria bacterium GW2011_GWA1_37_8]|uniref:Peptidase M29, aminopeptidase II n=2 Tax=Candidatus Woeseibacteriota TaxID=1752722 RepID=A0A0G0LGR4_9BACT|nr:MAG: Peptidase M29, aminopeptidase II [Microgenomates group bacterium GW2011_GWC1_37_12b]KKQ45298.1 MAG: Peptidase M29, aminopeptidase II [Candidatus Woesebacteria bacterium GW2011_GWA1_37_8]KKQ87100.1 MAG: Peptidase M29, aminopeptidase II [Candidatus Woesebacteria bacterium GW2011_GWB1_38_8b]